MSNILTIGYIGEGPTDERFLGNIIKRTFEELAFACTGQIEVFDPLYINVPKQAYTEQILEAAEKANWLNVLCIHVDADADSDTSAFDTRVVPAIQAIVQCQNQVCKNIVAIVPIHMTEAWMLADTSLLIDELGTDKTLEELSLPARKNQVERINDPKDTIAQAIRLAYAELPRRRNKLTIAELYAPISQKISLAELAGLSSYQKFRESATEALRRLNYMP